MHSNRSNARYSKVRVDALTDGIFAVAMTLLVLDIHLPEGFAPTDTAQMLLGLLDLLPKFIPYVVSFMLLGMRWLSLAQEYHSAEHVEGACPAIWVYCANTALIAVASWRMAQLTPNIDDPQQLKVRQVSMAVLLLSSVVCAGFSLIDPRQAIWAFTLNLAAPLVARWMQPSARS